jgi:hypothetical protein
MQTEYATSHNLPLKATLGGKETLYPEFMDKIAQYRAEEEAAKKSEAAKKPAAKK